MNLSKSDLRKIYRAKIAENQLTTHFQSCIASLEKQLETLLQNDTGRWAAYAPLQDEPLIKFDKLKSNVSWVFPRVEGDNIQFYEATQEQLVPNKWKILEPDPNTHRPVDLNSLSGIIVPGLAFDSKGYRLGRGMGFYDRALSDFSGRKIGVAFSWQIADNLPHEAFDIPMDVIVTEKQVIVSHSGSNGR